MSSLRHRKTMAWGNLGCRGLYASSDFVPEGLVEDGIVDREHPSDLGLGFKVSDQVFLEQRHLRIVEGKRIIFSNWDVRSEENLEVDFGALREPGNVDENFVPLKGEPRSFCEMATEILLECSSLIGIFVEAGEVLEQGFVATIGNEDAADFVELPALESPHHTVTDVEFQATQFLLQAVKSADYITPTLENKTESHIPEDQYMLQSKIHKRYDHIPNSRECQHFHNQ